MATRSRCSAGRDSMGACAWLLEVGSAMLASALLVALVLPAFGVGRAGGVVARNVASIVAMNAIAMGVDDYSVNVTIAGTGTGMIRDIPNGFSCSSGTCTFMYLFGAFEDANLTATPGAGSHFVMWSTGDCAGSTNPFCSFQTGPTNPTQTAVFALNPACCDPTTGACVVEFPCTAPRVLASPGATTCTPSPCPQPTACCDTTSGACTIALPSSVCPAGTFAAMASSCTPGLCPQPTACCDTTSGACTIALPSSVCPAGTVAAMASSCTPGLCPQPLACCDLVSGACSVVAPLAACPAGTVNANPLTSACAPGICPQATVCCDPVTGACVVAAPAVACAAGTFAAPGGASACVPSPCPFPGSPALLGCTDCWFNGPYEIVRGDGQISHLGGAAPNGAKAADDFTLAGDFVHDVKTITATLLTTTTVGLVKPRAEIWSDCNGCPSELLYTLDNAAVVETGLTEGLAFDGRPLRVVHVTFDVTNQTIAANRNIVLKGGNYWLSVFGRTDGLGPSMQMYDVTYWGTTRGFGGGVQGKPAYKIDGVPNPNYNVFTFPVGCGPTAWHSVVDDCCIGCTDLNFSFCSTACKVLVDNGGARRQIVGNDIGSTSKFSPASLSAVETRSADDFVLPGCQDYHICYVEACVATNCTTFEGVFELYANDCNKPSYALHGQPLFNQQYIATKIVPLNLTAFMEGKTVNTYKLEFHDLPIVLTGGRQYWISAGVKYTFSINERAFFCYNEDCARSCLIRWNEGRVLTATTLDDYQRAHGCTSPQICNGWAKTSNDFSFLIAGDGLTTPGPINATPWCPADYNRDGALNTSDIFDYLNSWFNGCP